MRFFDSFKPKRPPEGNNFTPRAQQVLLLARKEAARFNHNFVGTEHVLLGLIALGQGVAVNVLVKLGLNLDSLRAEVEKQVGTGPQQKMIGNIPYTPRVKKVLALAAKEARALNHTYVGSEHILLGLLSEGDGVAGRVLQNFKLDIEAARQSIVEELDPNFSTTRLHTPTSDMNPNPDSPKTDAGSIDTSRRYDIYCHERGPEIVVYRNALFKGRKKLMSTGARPEFGADYLELEQSNGQIIYVSTHSVVKFCEPGGESTAEIVGGKK